MFAPVQRLWTDSNPTRRPDALWKEQPLVLLSCYRRWQLQARRLSNQQSHHKRCFHKHQETLPKQTTVVDIRTIHRSGTVAASCMSSMLAYTTLQKCTFRGTKHTMGLPAPNKVHCSTHTVHAGGGAKLCQRYLWNSHSDCQFPHMMCQRQLQRRCMHVKIMQNMQNLLATTTGTGRGPAPCIQS